MFAMVASEEAELQPRRYLNDPSGGSSWQNAHSFVAVMLGQAWSCSMVEEIEATHNTNRGRSAISLGVAEKEGGADIMRGGVGVAILYTPT